MFFFSFSLGVKGFVFEVWRGELRGFFVGGRFLADYVCLATEVLNAKRK